MLDRLCQQPDSESWQRLVDVYTPLVQSWLHRYGVQPYDADDLLQDVLMVVTRELGQFRHNRRRGAFRSWLRMIVVHRLRDFWRSRQRRPVATGNSNFLQQLDQLEDAASNISRLWDQEHDRHVVRALLASIEPQFAPTTWRAFWRLVIDGAEADTVAHELGMSLNAVYIAKSRVLGMLRQEGQGLIA